MPTWLKFTISLQTRGSYSELPSIIYKDTKRTINTTGYHNIFSRICRLSMLKVTIKKLLDLIQGCELLHVQEVVTNFL